MIYKSTCKNEERKERFVSGWKKHLLSLTSGFTLIETIVAIGLFSIVMSIGVGAFAQALKVQRQATAFIAVNSNVSELLEQMSREIRTGKNFCNADTTSAVTCNIGAPDFATTPCDPRVTLAFDNAVGELTVYEYDGTTINKSVWKTIAGACTPPPVGGTPLTADNVIVEEAHFDILGNGPADLRQPLVTISLTIRPKDVSLQTLGATTLQTTVSSRQPDG